METWTETRSRGTDCGPVNWEHPVIAEVFKRDFLSVDDTRRVTLDDLRDMEATPEAWRATSDGGWPRCGVRRVLAFRMYDGWPWWQPRPAVLTEGVLGCEWHDLSTLSSIYRDPAPASPQEKP